jgi:hypothetical protein
VLSVGVQRIGFFRGFMYLTVAGVAVVSLYYIAKELFPSRMSPNHLFNEAFEAVKSNYDVSPLADSAHRPQVMISLEGLTDLHEGF